MPKLDALQTAERLQRQLDKLITNEEVAVRDLRALLTTEQIAAMDAAWQQQQLLRKQQRARTEEEQRALGWKTKREIQIDAVKHALASYRGNELAELEKQLKDKEIRQAKIFLREYTAAKKQGKDDLSARKLANNELTRAGLQRLDGLDVSRRTNSRDNQVQEMEEQILTRARSAMTDEEREQDDLIRDLLGKR